MSRNRLYVLGNCQALTYTLAFRQLLPDWDVNGFVVLDHNRADWLAGVAASEGADVIVFLPEIAELPELAGLGERMDAAGAVTLPVFKSFRYHPDMNVLLHAGTALYNHGLPLHSAVAFLAYRRGLGAGQVHALLSDPDLPLLGALGQGEEIEQSVVQGFEQAGIDMAPLLARWSRREAFMYLPNHPAATVLTDVAQALALARGWTRDRTPLEPQFYDPLSRVVLPVYPSVARAFGVPARSFAREESLKQYDLRGWIEAGYRTFRTWQDKGWLPQVRMMRDLDPHVAALL